MKRFCAMFLLLAILCSLVGCGAKEPISGPTEEQTEPPSVAEGQVDIPKEPKEQLVAPNGMTMEETENYGVLTVKYAGTTVPQGLGLPMLTDEEIDALLAENDPRKVKDTITTLADFVNYCYRGEFIFGDEPICFAEAGVGAETTCSGYQTLQRRIGVCSSMSSCLHYVLDEDYDEVGYVSINHHAMVYILCDGLYYLVNPVEYVFMGKDWTTKWLGQLPSGKYCSSNFQDIADSLYGEEIGETITYVYTCTGPGDFTVMTSPLGTEFPVGTTATCWYGEPVNYFLFYDYDWLSQENVVPEDVREVDGGNTDYVVEYLKEIGAITFTKGELATLSETGDLDEISRVITTAEDCTQFIAVSGIREGDNSSIKSAFTKKLLSSEKIVELTCRILDSDCEEVGMITTRPDHYYFLYVKQDGQYSIYDVLRAVNDGQSVSGESFDSSDAMINYALTKRDDNSATMKAWPW